jgi:hypothetical protein
MLTDPCQIKKKKTYLVQCFQILSYKTGQALILKQSNPYSCAYAGELEETMAELEESRRKLVILQLQRHGGSLMNMSGPNAVNGAVSADKSSDRNMGWGDLKDAVEEAKVLLTRANSIAYMLFICLICSAFIL